MFTFYEVGGAVRDKFLNVKSKDVDFTVVPSEKFDSVDSAFSALESHLSESGFEIFESKVEFATIRAKVPKHHSLRSKTDVADFVLARKDGPSSDGRHPDYVLPGTLHDDLARRDFTINAMALDENSNLIDPFNGLKDLQDGLLKFVGDPNQRIIEDGLRVIRAIRFQITKNVTPDDLTLSALNSDLAIEMLKKIPIDRIYKELIKMFKFDTIQSINILSRNYSQLQIVIFRDQLNLQPTLKKH